MGSEDPLGQLATALSSFAKVLTQWADVQQTTLMIGTSALTEGRAIMILEANVDPETEEGLKSRILQALQEGPVHLFQLMNDTYPIGDGEHQAADEPGQQAVFTTVVHRLCIQNRVIWSSETGDVELPPSEKAPEGDNITIS